MSDYKFPSARRDRSEGGWSVSFSVFRDRQGAFRLLSLDLRDNGARHRVTFARSDLLPAVLSEGVAHEVARICLALEDGPEVLTDPERVVTGGAVRLAGLHGIRFAHKGGPARYVLRFRAIDGMPHALLRRRLALGSDVAAERERIAVEALADVLSPLIALSSAPPDLALDQMTTQAVARRLQSIRESAAELQMQLSLLTRYVRDCSEMRATAERPVANLRHPDAGEERILIN